MPETATGLATPPPPANTTTATAAPQPAAPRNNIKETLVSLTIAFALAFVFRGFVVEAFLIPTGSMAPTLNGAHVRFSNPRTGMDWAVGPRQADLIPGTDAPRPTMGSTEPFPIVDPITRQSLGAARGARTRAGDRIFVMKYLYSIFDPSRYDIVVFKNPTEPQVNFIKRLLGLPGDQLALIDGDVWVRTPKPDDLPNLNAWQQPGWKVAAKPELAQRSMWQTVFDSQYTPVGTVDGVAYDSKWIVPAESVYAVLEVKQDLSREHILYAAEKAASVRRLHRTSALIPYAEGAYKARPLPPIVAGILTYQSSWTPALGEPLRQALSELSADHKLNICKRQSLIVQFWSFLTVQGGVDLRTKVFILV